MPEYIEREDLLKDISESVVFTVRGESSSLEIRGANKIIDRIKSAPTADVVEVVRCKDCKHRYVPCRCALWYGTNNGNEYFIERGDDFSCSYGKRKEGAEK